MTTQSNGQRPMVQLDTTGKYDHLADGRHQAKAKESIAGTRRATPPGTAQRPCSSNSSDRSATQQK